MSSAPDLISSLFHPSTHSLLHLSNPPPSTHSIIPPPLTLPSPTLHPLTSTHTHPDTSRSPRSHEINGQNFHFVSWQKMERDIQNNQFVEHGYLEGDYYGTSINSIRDVTNSGKTCLLVLFPSVSIMNLFSELTRLAPDCHGHYCL